jgi:hypothetical protein
MTFSVVTMGGWALGIFIIPLWKKEFYHPPFRKRRFYFAPAGKERFYLPPFGKGGRGGIGKGALFFPPFSTPLFVIELPAAS